MPGGGTTLPKYRSLATAVCGRVDRVLFDRDGVPFAGGGQPRYRVKWENGMLDTGESLGLLVCCIATHSYFSTGK